MTQLEYVDYLKRKLDAAGVTYCNLDRYDDEAQRYEQPARTPLYSNESMVNCNFVTCYNENADLKAKNAELQKQVDELKEENTELYKEHTTLIAGSILKQKDIAKDTAKEILQRGEYCMPSGLREWIEKRYGVEAE